MLIGLLKRFWPFILLGLVVFAIWWQIDSIIDERDEAILDVAKRDHELAVEKGRHAQSIEQGVREKDRRDLQYAEDLQYVVNAYLKDFNHDKKADQKTIDNLRDKLTNSLCESALRGSSNPPENDASQLTEENGNTAATGQIEAELREQIHQLELGGAELREQIHQLELGGALCAADFNACREYVDDENIRLGVEDIPK